LFVSRQRRRNPRAADRLLTGHVTLERDDTELRASSTPSLLLIALAMLFSLGERALSTFEHNVLPVTSRRVTLRPAGR
jgi:hypothetical protein